MIRELHDSFPQNVAFKNGLAISYFKLAQHHRNHLKAKAKAKMYFQKAAAIWQELVRDASGFVQFQKFLAIVQNVLADLEK